MKKPFIGGLHHVGIFSANLAESVKFYTEILEFTDMTETGLPTEEGREKIAFVKNGTLVLEFIKRTPEEISSYGESSIAHVAMVAENLPAVCENLKKAGIKFNTEEIIDVPHMFTGAQIIFFNGPSGETLELYEVI